MARKSKKPSIPPQQPGEIERFDEANSARLGLISVQERIPSDYTRWDIEFQVDGRAAKLTCISPSEYGGIPHGLDGDFATALNMLYLDQGAPDSGEVIVTAYQLLQKAGFTDSGQYYQALQASLDRLKGATYTASESWRDKRHQRWTTVKFNIIEQIDSDTEGGTQYGQGTMLKIRLARPVVQSLRDQYLKPLDTTFVLSLSRSLTRSLYRMLDARRYNPVDMSSPAPTLRLPLVQWARDCKLLETVPARIKRNLEGAHQELMDRGYLRSIVYEGQRGSTVIVYEFGDVTLSQGALEPALQVLPDPPVVEALKRKGVALPVARKLVSEYGETHVTIRLEKFEAIMAGGYHPKRPSAFLVDVIKDDGGKYNADGLFSPPTEPKAKEKRAALAQVQEKETEAAHDRFKREFQSLPRSEQAARAASQVRMFVGRELRDTHLKALMSAMLAGDIDPLAIQQEVTKAASELRLPEFAAQLRKTFGEPVG